MSKPDKVSRQTATVITILIAVNLVMTAIFVVWLLQGSKAKPEYTFTDQVLKISGQFGAKIDLGGAVAVQENTPFPDPVTRTGGAEIGKILKGHFKINGVRVYLSIMDKTASRYILITADDGNQYYINCTTAEETAALYQEISTHLSNK